MIDEGDRRPVGWTEFSEDVLRVAALSEGLASHARSLLGELSPTDALGASLSNAYSARTPMHARAALRLALAALAEARPHARCLVNGVVLVACELLRAEASEQDQTISGLERHGALVDRIMWGADGPGLAEADAVEETRALLTSLLSAPSILPDVSAFALDLLDAVTRPAVQRDLRLLWGAVERSADHVLDVDGEGHLMLAGEPLTFLESRGGVKEEQPITATSRLGQVILRAAAGRPPLTFDTSAVSRARTTLKRRQVRLHPDHRLEPALRCSPAALRAIDSRDS